MKGLIFLAKKRDYEIEALSFDEKGLSQSHFFRPNREIVRMSLSLDEKGFVTLLKALWHPDLTNKNSDGDQNDNNASFSWLLMMKR